MSASWAGGSTRAWRKLRAYVLQRDRWACQLPSDDDPAVPCGAYADQVDHVVPLAAGGAMLPPPELLRAACKRHNLSRGAGRRPAPSSTTRRRRRPSTTASWSW